MAINCCHKCVPPERHPGCHDKCPVYQEAKAKHDALKAADDKRKQIKGSLIHQRNDLYFKAMKKRRK